MTSLVIAEHDNASIKGATLNTVTAAAAIGADVHVLVAGHNAGAAAAAFIAAFLNAAFAFCLGCQIYVGLQRIGLIKKF